MQPLIKSAHDSKPRPALRLVTTNGMPRDDWLEVRKSGIGSSDAAAAVGLNPYKSQLELWLEKTGRDTGLPKVDSNDEESPAYWGNMLEPIVASHYTKRTGNRVRKINAVLQHPNPDYPWMLANIDREIIGATDVQILECKTAGINGARLWKEGVPEYVVLQVQHQLAVTGKAAADVAVLLGGQHLEIHRIQRDELLIKRLILLEAQFWQCVTTDTLPPVDGTESADRALRALYPEDNLQTVDFSTDSRMSALFADWLSVKQTLSDHEKVEAKIKQMIQKAMGEASYARFETGTVSWKKSRDSQTLDTAKLQQDYPELIAQYQTTKPGSRRFVLL